MKPFVVSNLFERVTPVIEKGVFVNRELNPMVSSSNTGNDQPETNKRKKARIDYDLIMDRLQKNQVLTVKYKNPNVFSNVLPYTTTGEENAILEDIVLLDEDQDEDEEKETEKEAEAEKEKTEKRKEKEVKEEEESESESESESEKESEKKKEKKPAKKRVLRIKPIDKKNATGQILTNYTGPIDDFKIGDEIVVKRLPPKKKTNRQKFPLLFVQSPIVH